MTTNEVGTPASPRTTVLVTGATGFLGRNVLAALSRRPDVTVVAACRTPDQLPADFTGEVRPGDLLDPEYRRTVVRGIDVVCHAGTRGTLWRHAAHARDDFYRPTIDLMEQAIQAGVTRFLFTGTVVVATVRRDGGPSMDDSPVQRAPGWPYQRQIGAVEEWMRANSHRGTQLVAMRLGAFVGAGNTVGLVPLLVPRLRTRLVPWLAGGHSRQALVADTDLGEAFALAATAPGLGDYESFNICGPEFPTTREVVTFLAEQTGVRLPWYSVPFAAGYAFGWLMEALHPVLPGDVPFLTRSIVRLSEDWYCPNDHARDTIGYRPTKDWRQAIREALADAAAEATTTTSRSAP
ncbi:MAG: NAD(P)-dependent oxidoreductase [Actinobacteria bacterium]|nr:NAD(P)-dependent oxidoreductase [Actinomycetota bacterium]